MTESITFLWRSLSRDGRVWRPLVAGSPVPGVVVGTSCGVQGKTFPVVSAVLSLLSIVHLPMSFRIYHEARDDR
jgi:hypothetical protein